MAACPPTSLQSPPAARPPVAACPAAAASGDPVDPAAASSLASALAAGKPLAPQYASIYFTRLNLLRPRIVRSALARWHAGPESPPHVPRILSLQTGVPSFIVGTIYIEMPLKPSILDQASKEQWSFASDQHANYFSDRDVYLIEDESGRIVLTGPLTRQAPLITGTIVGLLGSENEKGDFQVIDICYPDFDPQLQLASFLTNKPSDVNRNSSPWLALVSGLLIGNNDTFDMRYQMLLDFLTGESGSVQDQQQTARIGRVILCGNTVSRQETTNGENAGGSTGEAGGESSSTDTRSRSRSKFVSGQGHVDTGGYAISTLHMADTFLSSLCASVPVDMVSGSTDPTSVFLPQPRVHPSLFQRAGRLPTLKMYPNPARMTVSCDDKSDEPMQSQNDAVDILCCAGQPIDDLRRMTDVIKGTQLAGAILRWGHLAPTAPDTLGCHPFMDTDPFVFSRRPHLLIMGNQPVFDTDVIELVVDGVGGSSRSGDCVTDTTRVVFVPVFALSGQIVLVNLVTMECKTVEFGVCP